MEVGRRTLKFRQAIRQREKVKAFRGANNRDLRSWICLVGYRKQLRGGGGEGKLDSIQKQATNIEKACSQALPKKCGKKRKPPQREEGERHGEEKKNM